MIDLCQILSTDISHNQRSAVTQCPNSTAKDDVYLNVATFGATTGGQTQEDLKRHKEDKGSCGNQTYGSVYGTQGWKYLDKDAHQERNPKATAHYRLNQIKPDVTSEALIPEEDFGMNTHMPEHQNEESDVKFGTSEVKEPSTRHYDQCDMMFRIRAEPNPKRKSAPQRRLDAAEKLARCLRERVTLPHSFPTDGVIQDELNSGNRLPPVSCAFKHCSWNVSGIIAEATDVRASIEHPWDRHLRKHVLDHHREELHRAIEDTEADAWDVYKQALAIQERRCIPATGVSIDRRVFEYTLQIYNDKTVRSLICCACARIRLDTGGPRSDIEFKKGAWLFSLPKGSLHKNFSMAEFTKRYRQSGTPLANRGDEGRDPDFSEWRLRIHPEILNGIATKRDPYSNAQELAADELLCCPEDHRCHRTCVHENFLCPECWIPVCVDCSVAMWKIQLRRCHLLMTTFTATWTLGCTRTTLRGWKKQSRRLIGLA